MHVFGGSKDVCREYERETNQSGVAVVAPNTYFVPTNGIRVGERLKSDFKEDL